MRRDRAVVDDKSVLRRGSWCACGSTTYPLKSAQAQASRATFPTRWGQIEPFCADLPTILGGSSRCSPVCVGGARRGGLELVGLRISGIEAGRGGNPSATIETTTSVRAQADNARVRDGTVVSTIGDGLLGPPTMAI